MAKLIYSALASLDGYVADEDGNFDWAAPDEEVHRFRQRSGAPGWHVPYGRRMYEVMVYWATADKLVYSKTLEEASSAGRESSATSILRPSGR